MISLRTISKIWLMVLVFFYGLLFMLPASAAEVKIPQDCWTQEQCVGQAGNETDKYFFKVGDATFQTHCKGTGYGKCYITPDEVKLSVPIPDVAGGSPLTTVTQFPEYLKKIYTFFVWAIAIVAVAYLGFGGYEWIAAAGSAEQIGKAKDTIQGAIIGLLLALGSWVLLNTINSRLVEFDYIRVERIRPSALAHFCAEAEGTQQWIKVGDNTNVKVDAPDTWCNTEYYSSLNSNNTCMGLDCHDGSYCMPKTEASGFECVSLDDVDERCNDQEGTKEACDLFDQYVQTISSNLPTNATIKSMSCRYSIETIFEVGVLNENECLFTNLESELYAVDLEQDNAVSPLFDAYQRINCSDAPNICSDKTLTYKSHDPFIRIEVSCTDSKRAGQGTDSICIISKESVCASTSPVPITFDGYGGFLFAHDDLPNIWKEVSCSLFPPKDGNNCTTKCWALEINYYTPKF